MLQHAAVSPHYMLGCAASPAGDAAVQHDVSGMLREMLDGHNAETMARTLLNYSSLAQPG